VEEIVVTAFFLQTAMLMVPSAVAMFAARSTAFLLSGKIGLLHKIQGFMAMMTLMFVLSVLTPCGLADTNVLGKHTASISRAEVGVCSCETLVPTFTFTRCYNSEDQH
jgi:hypothetical protein